MTRLYVLSVLTCAGLLLAVPTLRADVKTEERTKFELGGMLGRVVNVFGGKTAREGVTSSVALKGQRKAMMTDSTGQIIDLAEEKVYTLDVKAKTYTVMTFADIRKRMEEARANAEKAAREQAAKDPAEAPPSQQAEQNVEFDLDVRRTGQKKSINRFDTEQALVTVTVREKGKTLEQSGGLVITTELWLAPRLAPIKELADFDLQYAQKLFGPMIAGASPQDMAAAMALYPMMKPALERMNAESSKLEGTPITTIVKVEAVKSAEQFAAEQKQRQESSKPNISGGVGGLIGGLGRRAAQQKISGDPQPRAMVMTTTTEVLKIATDVTDAEVAVPAGFKQR
jgi:hypothetical protein